ncbi:MAG: GNAT family N-acetyltransferase [Ktedonobacteraceae bacterium]|nr:GNAT family N-acetyltransferase [Ktedonobacteraceae bacterium]
MSFHSSNSHLETSSINVRLYTPADREFLLSLAPRLTIGIAPWRSREAMETAMRQFIIDSIEQHPTQTVVFVAVDPQEQQLGFASVSHAKNFTGEPQAYLGELAACENIEGRGVGSALIKACEEWARNQGYMLLVLDTGAGNERARRFYQHIGFQEESVRLIRQLYSAHTTISTVT